MRIPFLLKTALLGILASGALLVTMPQAQQTGKVLAVCNTASYTAGSVNYVTLDTTGGTCGSSGGTPISGTVTANQGAPAAQTLPNAWPVVIPSTTKVSTGALAANLVVNGAPSALVTFEVSADSTLSAAAWWIMAYDATTAPADGAVTPAKCYAVPSGATSYSAAFPIPPAFTVGVVLGVSTTGCFTKTASTHAFISADYR